MSVWVPLAANVAYFLVGGVIARASLRRSLRATSEAVADAALWFFFWPFVLLQKRRQDKELAALRARPLIEALSPEARRLYDSLPVYRDPPEANQ